MKQLVKNYTFSASGKTVTLTDFSTVLLERLQLIVDTTTNTILYNFADASVATATVATNIITLSTVGSASSSDKLQVIYDAATSDPTYDTPVLPANAAKETGGNLAAIASSVASSATASHQTDGTQQTKVTDGTNIVNVLKSDGTAAGKNAQMVAGSYMEKDSLSVASVTNNDLLASLDVNMYRSFSIQISGTWTGNITIQQSNDNTNFTSKTIEYASSGSTNGAAFSSNDIGSANITARYLRIRVTTGGTGTVQGTLELYSLPLAKINNGTAQVGTWAVGSNSATGSAVPANAFYVGMQIASSQLGGMSSWANTADNASTGLYLATGKGSYNGAGVDKDRNNTTGVVIAAGATSTNAGVNFTTYNASKAVIILNVSAFTSGTITVTVNGVTSSGYTYPILASTAIGATGVTPLRIFPGATPSANAVANDMVPRTLQVVTTGTFSLTYGIDYELSV